MNEPDPYNRLVAAARAGDVPPGFSDSVMQAIERDVPASWGTPVVRAAVWAAAVLVLAIRVGGALSVFWSV